MDALAYHIPDPEDLLECPYNKYHMVRNKRFQYHLMKCRQQYSGAEFHVCPFNAKHEMPKPELRYHISICPDKARIRADLLYEQSRTNGDSENYKGCTDVPSYHYDFKMPEPTENWDEETLDNPRIGVDPSFFYNPKRIKDTTGMTRAEKKAFEQYLINPGQNGFIESGASHPSQQEPQNERIRTPQSTPMVYQQAQQHLPKPAPKPSSIFAYSLSMAGVGRGRGMAGVPGQAAPGQSAPRPGAGGDNSADGAAVLMALAMGRGMGRARAPGMQSPQAGAATVSSSESQDEDSAASCIETNEDAKKKEMKKLQKKLRQIQGLEDKQDTGANLTTEELEKISKREELEKALECMNLN